MPDDAGMSDATQPPEIGAMFGAVDVTTFMGLPAATVEEADSAAAILGAPSATPYASVGAYCRRGPAAIRAGAAPYAGNLAHMDFDLGGAIFGDGPVTAADCGDLETDETHHGMSRDLIRTAVGTLLDRGIVPLVLGGDDSVPIPMLEAYAGRRPITILQIDAHIDWRDEVQGEHFGLSSTMRRASEMPHVERIIQVGQRAIGSARVGDHADALAAGVQFVSARDLHAHGVAPVLELIPRGAEIFVAFDVDALDPAIMPATIGPAPGGLTYFQAVDLLIGAADRGRIAGFDLVEFMADRDEHGIGALTAARLVAVMLGLVARQAAAASA
jgi:agmatinase